MVKEQLTDEMIQLGKEILKKLDEANLNISSAFWFYLEDAEKWRFILATPQVRIHGPKVVYQKIKQVLSKFGSDRKVIDLKDISVIEDNHSSIKIMSKAIGPISGIAEERFSRNTINGHYIEDALIYRLNFPKKVA